MKAYKAEELRAFTEALFRGDSFDRFLLVEASFQTAFSLELDGRVAKDWYGEEERQSRGVEDFVRWGEVKTLAFQAIRGKRAPSAFRVVLRLDLAESTAFLAESGSKLRPEEVSGFYLNLNYEEKTLRIVSGVSVKVFPGDKALEQLWDRSAAERLQAMGLVIAEL